VALRLSIAAPMPGAGSALRLETHAAETALKGRRPVQFPEAGGAIETPVYDRYALPAGTRLAGPAVFEENESTFIVGPGARISVLPDLSILAERAA
jgi:N-methylhydantoinase A